MTEADAVYQEGMTLKKERRHEEAVEKFQQSLSLDAGQTVALHALVQCYTEMAKHEEAITTAKKIVEQDPKDVMSYICLSRAYQQAGMIPEAETAMMKGQQVQMAAQSPAASGG